MSSYPLKIVQENNVEYILDHIRKKYVQLTPEEYVRQQLIQYLVEECNYPKGCFSVEKRIKIGERNLRYDIVIYKDINPWMLVECKAPNIKLTANIFMQSLVYQNNLQAKYIMLTNGEQTLCMDIEKKIWVQEMVVWENG